MSRPLLCDGCGQLMDSRGTVYALLAYAPLDASQPDAAPRSCLTFDFCSAPCGEHWLAAVSAPPAPIARIHGLQVVE
jgi:hypothetical protein